MVASRQNFFKAHWDWLVALAGLVALGLAGAYLFGSIGQSPDEAASACSDWMNSELKKPHKGVDAVDLKDLAKAAAPTSGRRGRRGRSQEQQPAFGTDEAEKKQSRLVVDPELDDPFEVAFTLAVYDFGGKVAEEGDKDAAAPKDAGAPAGGDAADASVQQGKEAK